VLKTIAALVVAAGIACTTAPAAETLHVISAGVSVAGTTIGGMIAQPAGSRIRTRFMRPIVVVYRGRTYSASPARFRARPAIDAAVRTALSAGPGRRIPLPVRYSSGAVALYVDAIAARVYRAPRNAALLGATDAGPTFRDARRGLAVDEPAMNRAIERQLASGVRRPLELATEPIAPARTVGDFRAIVVIDRAANTLRLFRGDRLVRRFQVATGQPAYPTPSGFFRVVDKQLNPWWTPPNSPWAAGAKPIPPGPGNPLGTRWMGLSTPGVGIHGTPNDWSIGYSESHGCIRMHIPEAEWLFDRVSVGTPVVIL
jgi:lipoprotein-anchoring transpeptidase ErfK/SrfK